MTTGKIEITSGEYKAVFTITSKDDNTNDVKVDFTPDIDINSDLNENQIFVYNATTAFISILKGI